MGKRFLFLLLLMLISFFELPGNGQKEDQDKVVTIFTSIMPQKFFVERIGGKRVAVHVLVSPGMSPATYEPTPRQVIRLSQADLLFTIGVPFEQAFIPIITNSLDTLRVIDTSENIEKREFILDENMEEHLHTHQGVTDPHIWLSPSLVKIQATTIYNALIEFDPEGESVYKDGFNSFIEELDSVILELHSILDPLEGSSFFVFHPSFGYFTDEFGLIQKTIESGGKEPLPSELEEIIINMKEERIKTFFVQPEFSRKSANAIAEAIGGGVVVLNPLDLAYINNLRYMALEIKKVYSK